MVEGIRTRRGDARPTAYSLASLHLPKIKPPTPNQLLVRTTFEVFPRETLNNVTRAPACQCGNTVRSLSLGRSHIPWSNQAHAPQLLSPRAAAPEACAHQSLRSATGAARTGKPVNRNSIAAPTRHNWRQAGTAVKTQHTLNE